MNILPDDMSDHEARIVAEMVAQEFRFHLLAAGVPVKFANGVVASSIANARRHALVFMVKRAAAEEAKQAKEPASAARHLAVVS